MTELNVTSKKLKQSLFAVDDEKGRRKFLGIK